MGIFWQHVGFELHEGGRTLSFCPNDPPKDESSFAEPTIIREESFSSNCLTEISDAAERLESTNRLRKDQSRFHLSDFEIPANLKIAKNPLKSTFLKQSKK